MVVIVLVAAVLLMNPKEAVMPAPVATEDSSMEDTAATAGMKMRHSLRELIGMNTPLRCSYDAPTVGGTSKGVSYVMGAKVRTDGTVTAGGNTTTFSSIMDGEYLYAWGNAAPEGMKMRLATIEGMADGAGAAAEASKTADMDQAYDYDCAAWGVDMSVFAPPPDVTFMDYDEMMQGMEGMRQGLGNDAGMMEGMEAYETVR